MPRKKATTMKRRKAPPEVKIRNNARPSPTKDEQSEKERRKLSERMREMDASHALIATAAGTIGNALSVLLVGLGWASPKATAGVLMGTGAATAAAGYYWEADHAMVAGAGLTTAGTWSLAQQYAVDAYEAIENRLEDKKAKDDQKQLAGASDQKPESAKPRNAAPRLIVVRDDHDGYHDD